MDHKCCQFPHRIPLRSNIQAQKLALKRVSPKSLEFHLDEPLNPHLFRRISKSFYKFTPKLKNPPVKQIVQQKSFANRIKSLTISPEEAASCIKKIAINFTRLESLFIHSQDNSFAPMMIKSKIPPIRSLRTFSHDHELCKDFMACAKYATFLRIKKSSLNLADLKNFKHLQTLYIVFKAKFVAFEEDDRKLIAQLASVIDSYIPTLNRIILEHEINPENNPYIPLQLYNELKGRIQVDLIADLVDVSNYRVLNNSIESILKDIYTSGVRNISINYAGIMKTVKKVSRSFPVPIHLRKDIYVRLLKGLLSQEFSKVHITPAFHSSHLSHDLKDNLLELIKLESRITIPKVTLIYCLDTLDEDSFELMLDLYNEKIPSYEIIITNTIDLTHEQLEKLESHYLQVVKKVKNYKIKFSVSIAGRTYKNLVALTKIILPISHLFLIKSLSVKVINAISKVNLKGLVKLLTGCLESNSVSKLEMNISQKETVNSQDMYEIVGTLLQKVPQLQRFTFIHQNSDGYGEILCEAFEKLRRDRFGVDLKYEVNREKEILYE